MISLLDFSNIPPTFLAWFPKVCLCVFTSWCSAGNLVRGLCRDLDAESSQPHSAHRGGWWAYSHPCSFQVFHTFASHQASWVFSACVQPPRISERMLLQLPQWAAEERLFWELPGYSMAVFFLFFLPVGRVTSVQQSRGPCPFTSPRSQWFLLSTTGDRLRPLALSQVGPPKWRCCCSWSVSPKRSLRWRWGGSSPLSDFLFSYNFNFLSTNDSPPVSPLVDFQGSEKKEQNTFSPWCLHLTILGNAV